MATQDEHKLPSFIVKSFENKNWISARRLSVSTAQEQSAKKRVFSVVSTIGGKDSEFSHTFVLKF